MPRHHTSSYSSGSSYGSSRSYGSHKTYKTDITAYSDHQTHSKKQSSPSQTANIQTEADPRASSATYASTVDLEEETEQRSKWPLPAERFRCYEPDFVPATSSQFACLFPTTRRLLIQHDETAEDGNMNLHVDTEIPTSSGRKRKICLFHLRMKDLCERDFSLRRYCRDSGREVASCKRKYVKSAPSTPKSRRPSLPRSLTSTLENFSFKPSQPRRQDSGYESADSDFEDERKMKETLDVMTTPKERVISEPTSSIRLEFSNYAQVIIDRRKSAGLREYAFEYWGYSYAWQREKKVEDGETIYSYHLIRQDDGQKLAIIMPDALSAQEAQWEATQGGWVPASSMRILKEDISDDLGDVIVATGLISLTDDCMRRHFYGIDRRR